MALSASAGGASADVGKITIQRSLILATAAFLFFVPPVGIAIWLRQLGAVLLALAWLLPLCGFFGFRMRGANLLRAFCCCTVVVGILFVVGCITLLGAFRVQLDCVCDVSCTSITLPAAPGAPGGGRNTIDPSELRNETRWQNLCAAEGSVRSSMIAYVVLGVLAMLLQCVACGIAFPLAAEYARAPAHTDAAAAYVPTAVPVAIPMAIPVHTGLPAHAMQMQQPQYAGGSVVRWQEYATPYASPYVPQGPLPPALMGRGNIT